MKIFRGDLFHVLSELECSEETLDVIEELLRCKVVKPDDVFCAWRTEKRIEVIHLGRQSSRPGLQSDELLLAPQEPNFSDRKGR